MMSKIELAFEVLMKAVNNPLEDQPYLQRMLLNLANDSIETMFKCNKPMDETE